MSLVRYTTSDTIATLTIDRPEALNALNAEVLVDLGAAVERAVEERARALIVTGAGDRAFVAGADVVRMSGMDRREARAFSELGNRVFAQLSRCPIPSIAAVNGYALGGGCELALACDLRIASEQAAFGQPEVGLGITPGFGGTQRLARLVGPARAKELLFTGRRIDARRALAIGLVNEVVAADELLPVVTALAAEIASRGPIAVRATKRAVSQGLDVDLTTALAIEAAEFASCFETGDQREAMAAFTQKRAAAPFRDR